MDLERPPEHCTVYDVCTETYYGPIFSGALQAENLRKSQLLHAVIYNYLTQLYIKASLFLQAEMPSSADMPSEKDGVASALPETGLKARMLGFFKPHSALRSKDPLDAGHDPKLELFCQMHGVYGSDVDVMRNVLRLLKQ
jgi:hypothetical protein